MSADTAGDAISKLGGPLENLGWLEESITFGRPRWVLLDDEGRSASITVTLTGDGEPSVRVVLEGEPGTENKPVEFVTKAESIGILTSVFGTSRMTMNSAVDFVLAYARLLAFRPSASQPQPPPGRWRQS